MAPECTGVCSYWGNRVHCYHFFPTLCSVMSHWYLKSCTVEVSILIEHMWQTIQTRDPPPHPLWEPVFKHSLAHQLPDVQAGFRKGRGTRDQIDNIQWIMEKAREFQKNIYFCFIDYAKPFDCVDHNKLENSERDGNTRPPDLPLEKSVCRSGSNS